MTYLWGEEKRIIVSDITEPDGKVELLTITKEIADANPNNYAIVLTAANYVACRLRGIPPIGSLADASLVHSPTAVRFVASAMMNPQIVKGVLCHVLWILTPVPEPLECRSCLCAR